MSLVNKIFGRRHSTAASGPKTSDAQRLQADRARQLSVPAAQSFGDQAATRARMEQELADQRARREGRPSEPTG